MFSTMGALLGLTLAIVLIVRKVTPVYALILGALVGGLMGGGTLPQTVSAMLEGTKGMMPSVLRILASGVLVGALVQTGSAAKIADLIVSALGVRFALAAIALATMVVCAVGVFVDIAVITVAPVALAVGRKASLPIPALLLAMIGGGKAGNVISPNPNTIATADAFHLELTSLMAVNLLPALVALVVTVCLSKILARQMRTKGVSVVEGVPTLPSASASAAFAGPLTVVLLLVLRPLVGWNVDPLVALPVGGVVSILACGKIREIVPYAEFGLGKVAGVSILLIGTGTVAGIVKSSGLNADLIALLNLVHLPAFALAPVAGVSMAAATASTTAGATIAAQTFAEPLVSAGVPALASAAMIHAGATVLDSLPHGSFFHATGGAVGLSVSERLRLVPYEAAVGLASLGGSILISLVK